MEIKVGDYFQANLTKDIVKVLEVNNDLIKFEIIEDPNDYWWLMKNKTLTYDYEGFNLIYRKKVNYMKSKLWRVLNGEK